MKKGTSSKEAFVRMIYDLVQEKIITQKEAGVRLKEIDLEALKYEPVKEIPQDARNVGRGKVASHGTTQGVAVFSAKKALEYKKKGVPTILVKPITTAEDKNAISLSAGVIALEEFRNHAQELSLKYKVPAVVEVTGSNFDTVTHEITLSGKHIEEGKTVLMLTKDGRVFVREIEPSQIEDEVLMTRKYALEEFIVEAMIWQIEAEGYQPELTVDKYGVGELWNEVLEDQKISVEEYSQAKSIRRQDNQAVIQGVKDVVRGVNQTLEEIALEERIISAESIEGLAQKSRIPAEKYPEFYLFSVGNI
ncbi:MAG: hypothetical protein KJ983_04850 [Candidatus Omnitrophica bacterium]|nr:hypothetical protein [Candidatus Omnitrophota bacterium]